MHKRFRNILCAAAVLILMVCIMADGYMKKDLQASQIPDASDHYISVETDQGIREIAFEDYVMGAAACQIGADSHPEALKAQMVIVRTNLYKELEENTEELLNVPYRTLEELQQMEAADSFQAASEATYGQVLKEGETLVRLPYHRVSAGRTREGAEALPGLGYDWLSAAECQSDQESPEYLGIGIWKAEDLGKAIADAWPDSLELSADLTREVEITRRDSSDYALEVRIGTQTVSGEKFREVMGLSSSCFFLDPVEGGIRITTKGFGHGLGLSQFQAELMAEAGAGYQEILSTFFKNLQIGTYQD